MDNLYQEFQALVQEFQDYLVLVQGNQAKGEDIYIHDFNKLCDRLKKAAETLHSRDLDVQSNFLPMIRNINNSIHVIRDYFEIEKQSIEGQTKLQSKLKAAGRAYTLIQSK